MPNPRAQDLVERETPVAEMRAIEPWDLGHGRDILPTELEGLAFMARQERLDEIVDKLLRMILRFGASRREKRNINQSLVIAPDRS